MPAIACTVTRANVVERLLPRQVDARRLGDGT
jgi:hypothetical protein